MSAKTSIFRFGTPRQETGSKHITQGDLIEARNVRMVKAGVYGKRHGFARTAMSFSGGTLSGTPESVLRGNNGATLMRDSGGQVWEKDPSSNTMNYRGKVRRSWTSDTMALSQRYTSPMPCSVLVGTKLWMFALKASAYDLAVVDTVSGVQTVLRTGITATNIAAASAAYDGTYVWLFWVDNTTTAIVKVHKFTATDPSGSYSAINSYTMPAAPVDVSAVKLQHVKAKFFSAANQVFVVAAGGYVSGGTNKRACVHYVLDPATGLAVAAGGRAAALSVAYSGASGSYALGGVYIHDGQDGSAATWYYTLAGIVDTAYTTQKWVQVEVSSTTFATFTLRALDNIAALSPPHLSASAAFCSGGYQIIFTTTYTTAGPTILGQPGYNTRVYHVSGSTVTTKTFPSATTVDGVLWVAGGFALVGSVWYGLMAFDDFGITQTIFGSESLTTQRTYYPVRVSVGSTAEACTTEIDAHHAMGLAPALFHKNTAVVTYSGSALPVISVPHLYTIGTKVVGAVAFASSVTGFVDVGAFFLETSKTFGQDCMMGNERGVVPGNIPMVWGNNDSAHEIAPLIAPTWMQASGGAPGGIFSVAAATYVITSPDGTVWRSRPFVLQTAINASATISAPVLPIFTPGVSLSVEFYLGTTVPKLQQVIPISSFSGGSVLYICPATVGALVDGEALYSWGGAISNAPPIPCTAAAYFKNRLLLANKQTVYASSERSELIGPYFNEAQASYWGDSESEITGMRSMDDNYCAAFSAVAVGVLAGVGPDQRGNGNFEVKTISSRAGLAAGGATLRGPNGVLFQSNATGRIMIAMPSLEVKDAGGGAWDYSSYVITSAAWWEQERVLVLASRDSSAFLVVDLQHPTEAAPFGQMYLWTTAAAQKCYGCDADSTGLIFAASDGAMFRPASQYVDDKSGGTDTYRMKLATAELQPSGMQGEFSVSWIQALVSVYATTGATLTIYPGFASRTLSDSRVTSKNVTLTCANAGDPSSFAHRPSYCGRVPSVGLAIEEAASVTNQSFEFEGFALEYVPHGRLVYPAGGKVI